VFLYNENGTVSRVSRAGLTQGDDDSTSPDISADGRFVVFRTYATNLLYGFDNGAGQLLRRSLLDGSYVGISAQAGQPGYGTYGVVGSPAISADGRYVAFSATAGDLVTSPPPGGSHIYLRDTVNATTAGVTRTPTGWADGGSGSPAISSDGRWVTFDSYATNLSPADTGTLPDVYVFDASNGTHRLVSVDAAGHPAEDGGYASSVSADGRYVVFVTSSSNLSPLDLNQDSDAYRWDALGTR
jgi:Tol biopolymer transport system component